MLSFDDLLFSNILIGSSDEALGRALRPVLQNAGYTVQVARTGSALLEAVTFSPPRLLLVDTGLPDMDVLTVIRHIKTQRKQNFFPIIALSDPGVLDPAVLINAGADELLNKPVSNTALLVRVRSMLRLKAITEELQDLNATLEEKVIERTEALDKAHAALRHTEKLGALGRLAASVAHEINNPLTGISTYLYLLKQQLPSDARAQANIEVIERQVAAITQLTKKLQRFSKPAQEQRRPVAISQVAEDVLTLVSKNLEQHKIEVTYTCAPDIPPLLASADQLGEVLLNLLLNARDAMPAGGQLYLEITEEAQTVCITVRDTGEGMPPEVQEHIFEPFYTTKGEQGTGLGLAISYRIIQEHGGDINVVSAPGAGTTFTIRLPLNAAHTMGQGAETHVYQLENP